MADLTDNRGWSCQRDARKARALSKSMDVALRSLYLKGVCMNGYSDETFGMTSYGGRNNEPFGIYSRWLADFYNIYAERRSFKHHLYNSHNILDISQSMRWQNTFVFLHFLFIISSVSIGIQQFSQKWYSMGDLKEPKQKGTNSRI